MARKDSSATIEGAPETAAPAPSRKERKKAAKELAVHVDEAVQAAVAEATETPHGRRAKRAAKKLMKEARHIRKAARSEVRAVRKSAKVKAKSLRQEAKDILRNR